MKTVIFRFFILMFLPIIVAVGYLCYTIGFGLPQVQGELNIHGIVDNISINRDENAAVYIKANNDDDAFFGLGFAHAQDRLWQLELQRRLAQGRLSEILGSSYVGIDAQMRTLQLYRPSQSAWDALSPQAKSSLTAYSAGINTWIKSADSLPLEFYLLDVTCDPWTELDSLAWMKVIALQLSNNMWSEITRFVVRPYLSDDQKEELFVRYPKDDPITVTKTDTKTIDTLRGILDLQNEFQQRLKMGGEFVGSNAWVISGKLTKNGDTILANDPHLSIQIPSIWYMASLSGNRINSTGMSIVGLPVIIFGRNQKIVWGGTNMMADVQDLYFEQVNGANASQYLDNGQWLEFEIQKQYINVRPEYPLVLREAIKPVEVKVRKTIRGPVVNDVFGLSDQPVTLRWTALDENDTTYESFFRLNYANDWSSFKSALGFHVVPALNFVYSDTQGNIGYLGAGKIPIRSKGRGETPITSDSSEYQWTGYIPFEDLPQSYNPEKGYIVTANNKVIDDSYPYHITFGWAPSDRANRIEELIQQGLQDNKTLSLDYMKKIQSDTLSFGAVRLIMLLKAAPMESDRFKLAQQYVINWNGDMSINSQGASIFYNWARHLRIVLFEDELSSSFGRSHHDELLRRSYMGTTYNQLAAALIPGGVNWCDDIITPNQEDCQWAIQHALDLAIKELSKLAGSDMNDWAWGSLHSTVYSHTPFSDVDLLKLFFERRIENGGGPNTINVAAARFVGSNGFEQYTGATFRQIIKLGKTNVNHLYMNSTGQSGNVFSLHYDDMVESFRDVLYVDINKSKIKTELFLKSKTKTIMAKE